MIKILVKDIVGSNAISMTSGGKLLDVLVKNFDKSEVLELNFEGVDVFASPFFNASIGALLKDRKIEELQAKLSFVNISDTGRSLLNLVIRNAIKFYSESKEATRLGLDDASKEL